MAGAGRLRALIIPWLVVAAVRSPTAMASEPLVTAMDALSGESDGAGEVAVMAGVTSFALAKQATAIQDLVCVGGMVCACV